MLESDKQRRRTKWRDRHRNRNHSHDRTNEPNHTQNSSDDTNKRINSTRSDRESKWDILRRRSMRLESAANENTIMRKIRILETRVSPPETTGSGGAEHITSGDRDLGCRIARVALINPRNFPDAFTVTISALGLHPEIRFMFETGTAPNLVKARNLLPET